MLCLSHARRLASPAVTEPDPQKGPAVQSMFSSIAARYDLTNHLLSGGLDFFWWRLTARRAAARKPARILDLATGSGDLALTLRAACPESLIVGGDFCPPMLHQARRKGVPNLVAADAMRLPFASDTFDVITVAFGLRNMASWSAAIREMGRVLRPGGLLLILDFSVPPAPLRWIYRPYLHHILPRVAGWLTGEASAYVYLGESIEGFPCGPAMCALISASGLAQATAEPLTGGIVTLYSAVRPVAAMAAEVPAAKALP